MSADRTRPGTIYFLSGNKGKQQKNENTNNETVSVLGSREFQLSVTSVKCVTSAAYIPEQERRLIASQVI
jgi:hypothetical protein